MRGSYARGLRKAEIRAQAVKSSFPQPARLKLLGGLGRHIRDRAVVRARDVAQEVAVVGHFAASRIAPLVYACGDNRTGAIVGIVAGGTEAPVEALVVHVVH